MKSLTWFPRVCCPECYGPARARLHDKEGRCRACRPKRQHSQPRELTAQSRYVEFLNEHRRSAR